MNHCPLCRQSIKASAIVDEFNDPANWEFWGKAGERWIVCRSDSYVHFRVKMGGRDNHRLAIIRSQSQEWLAVQEAAQVENKQRRLIK